MNEALSPTQKYAQLILRFRWWVILASILFVFAAFSGGKYLAFNNDYRIFFSEDNPQLLAYEHMENTYNGKDENILVVLSPKNGLVFTRETLAVIEKFTELAWQTPYSTRIDSLSNFQHSYAMEDDLIIENLVSDAKNLSDDDLFRIKSIAVNEPLLVKRLISEKAHVTGINITIKLPKEDATLKEVEVVQHVRGLADQIRKENPNLEVYLTGNTMLNIAFAEASEQDMKTLLPITFLVFLISIALLTKGWTGAFASMWLIIFSIMSGLGLAGWLRIDLSSVSAAAPTIILTLAIANAVHVIVGLVHGMREGKTKYDAIVESVRVNIQPIMLTNLTTTLGFLTMNFSDSPVFHDLGNIVSMGVITSMLLSLTFLPALMMVLPMRKPSPKTNTSTLMDKLAEFVIQHQNKLLLSVGAFFVFLVLFLPKNDLNDEWVQYFDKSLEFRQATDFTTDNLTGAYRVDYSINANGKDSISEPEFLKQVDAFVAWYKTQPEVVQVTALTDIIKRLNKNMHNDDPAYHAIPSNSELSAQYLLLYEMSLPYGLDLNNQIDMNKSSVRLTATTHNLSVKETIALEQRVQDWLLKNTPDIRADGTGAAIMFAHIGVRNIKSMLLGTTLALMLISIILILAFRSVKIGAISLIPNLMPSIMGFGLWGLLVGEVGLGLATVAGVTMGIVVDDTVHFLSKYLRGRREKGLSPEDSVRYAFSTVGTALWFTTVTIVAGFAVMSLSTFKMNADMGSLTAVTIAFALLADFLFLPPLLIKLDKVRLAVGNKKPGTIDNVQSLTEAAKA